LTICRRRTLEIYLNRQDQKNYDSAIKAGTTPAES
jgi:hypothetical protein